MRVAVATNFSPVAKQIGVRFERETGYPVMLSSGSTGKLYAQIEHGAPFDLFLAADSRRPKLLQQSGKAVPGTIFTYALGKIALWSPRPGFVDGNGNVLKEGIFDRLAIANPRFAPYGLAARQVMEGMGVWRRVQPRLVQGESVAQAFQFVASGNAALGFVALSQIRVAGGGGSLWEIPTELYQPIRQQAVLLQRGSGSSAARAFLHYLQGGEARELIRSMGYGVTAHSDRNDVAE